jgi:phage repressor protein C with HTH and peptisase S24 domain
MKTSFRDAFLAALATSGRSLLDVSTEAGVSYEQMKKFKQGRSTSTNVDDAAALAGALGMSIEELLDGADAPQQRQNSVAVAGKVGAGAEVELWDPYAKGDGLYHVECPPQIPPKGVVAVEVKGDSMEPVYSESDVLFYTRATHDGVPTEAIGKKCIVEDEHGKIWVKHLKIGSEDGRFSMLSINPTGTNMHNVVVKWAAPVRLHLPAELVKRTQE